MTSCCASGLGESGGEAAENGDAGVEAKTVLFHMYKLTSTKLLQIQTDQGHECVCASGYLKILAEPVEVQPSTSNDSNKGRRVRKGTVCQCDETGKSIGRDDNKSATKFA